MYFRPIQCQLTRILFFIKQVGVEVGSGGGSTNSSILVDWVLTAVVGQRVNVGCYKSYSKRHYRNVILVPLPDHSGAPYH